MDNSDPAYFLYHSIGQYPGKAADMAAAMAGFSQIWGALDDAQWPKVLAERSADIDLWRALIDAPEGTVTHAENVTAGLYSVLGGLPEGYLRGRKLLVTADCFPSLHFLLNGLQERLGFTLVTVPLRDGAQWVSEEDILAHWDAEVGVALLTFVTSTASFRCDLAGLMAHGRAMGTLVGVDLTQGIGIIPFSLQEHPADFALSTSLKWLCGSPGAGMIYMRPELLRETKPELRGWFSQPDPFSWALDAFEYAPDARRLDHGTPSILASMASLPALRWHRAQEGLLAHNRALTQAVIDGADALGLALASPREAERRGGSVMVRLPDEVVPHEVVAALRERQFYTDAQGLVLRLSPGNVTRQAHVEGLFSALAEIINH